MTRDNVVDASRRFDRSRSPSQPAAIDALEKLRATTRTNLADRIILARKLGEAAARLNPKAPKKGAHAIMNAAWAENGAESGAKKTGRLFVFEGKDVPDVLESSGPSWANLVDKAARLIVAAADHHPGHVDREIRYQVSRLLRGTSFLPSSPEANSTPVAVRELLGRLADKFIQRVQSNTRLFELWRVLDQTPFAVEHVDPPEPAPPSVVPEASRLADRITWHWLWEKPDNRESYFVPIDNDASQSTSWPHVFVKIGAYARQVRIRTFIPPSNVADAFLDPKESDEEAWAKFDEWQSGDPDVACPEYPDHDYDEQLGHGGKSETYDVIYYAYLCIEKDERGMPNLYVHIGTGFGFLYPYLSPPLANCKSIEPFIFGQEKSALQARHDPFNERLSIVTSKSVSEIVDKEYIRHSPVRLVYYESGPDERYVLPYYNEVFDSEGFKFTDEHDEITALIFGSEEFRFIPNFPIDSNLTTPARKGSLADALLNNAALPADKQLINIIERDAKTRADAGLGYHHALICYYREIIDKA